MNWFPDLNTTEIIVLLLSETRNKDNNKQREIYIVNFIIIIEIRRIFQKRRICKLSSFYF